MTRLFLSYATTDQEKAAALATVLESAGFEPFFAPTSMRPGGFWLPRLAEEIQAADAFVLVLPTREPGPWQLLEYYEALARKAREPRFPLIPVLLPDGSLRLPFLDQIHWLDVPDPKAPEVAGRIRAILDGEAPLPASEPWRHLNPYRGFNAMEEADADFFFGRDREIGEILDAFAAGRRGVMLVGNSGVGKSSLAEAGVVAALRRQKAPGEGTGWPSALAESRRWAFVRVRPEGKPLQSLARAFVRFWTEAGSALRDEEAEAWARRLETVGLEALLTATREVFKEKLAAEPPVGFFLILNQGEELYQGGLGDEARRFSSVLGEALERSEVRLLGSLRSDYYGAFQEDGALFSRMSRVDVPPWQKPEEILPVIREPAARLEARFDTETGPEDIAKEVAKAPGGLPPLSYLLEDLWTAMQKRGDGELLWDDYRRLGGVEGVLSKRLQGYLSKISGRESQVRNLFTLRLAQVERGREVSRRVALKSECTEAEWAHVDMLAGEDWRLLVTGEKGGEPTAQVAHESILRAEGIVAAWIKEDLTFLEAKERLESERTLWEEKGKASEWLLVAGHLKETERQVETRKKELPQRDLLYLEASRRQRRRPLKWSLLLGAGLGIIFLIWTLVTSATSYQLSQIIREAPADQVDDLDGLSDWAIELARTGNISKALAVATHEKIPTRGLIRASLSSHLYRLNYRELADRVYADAVAELALEKWELAPRIVSHFVHSTADHHKAEAERFLAHGLRSGWFLKNMDLAALLARVGRTKEAQEVAAANIINCRDVDYFTEIYHPVIAKQILDQCSQARDEYFRLRLGVLARQPEALWQARFDSSCQLVPVLMAVGEVSLVAEIIQKNNTADCLIQGAAMLDDANQSWLLPILCNTDTNPRRPLSLERNIVEARVAAFMGRKAYAENFLDQAAERITPTEINSMTAETLSIIETHARLGNLRTARTIAQAAGGLERKLRAYTAILKGMPTVRAETRISPGSGPGDRN